MFCLFEYILGHRETRPFLQVSLSIIILSPSNVNKICFLSVFTQFIGNNGSEQKGSNDGEAGFNKFWEVVLKFAFHESSLRNRLI